MNNKRKIIFILILLICSLALIIKDKIGRKDDIYVLTENNELYEDNIEEREVEKEEKVISNKEITVYISGEVNNPGIVTLNNGDRLAIAVEKVGGTTKSADLNGINMAIKVQDEMHYIIPKVGEINKSNENNIISHDNTNKNEKLLININTATVDELDALPGVGEATANKIVNHRNENGEFKSIEEIKDVNGIGNKKFDEIKSLICVE